ncbi:hypothetical protein LPW26_00800 [Rhodopseudomonas sp. HC1]|uniref:hypothetical protein n=1 Tax=Rhodopseudomonas infernalis TaxID=2897386 RepID=UPI001EE97975|nr:hypothetical protein [Rhodopseudomonas infernalis]MCG6203160.1 hypothetical protein [Rhodopseudomonas infernalis]
MPKNDEVWLRHQQMRWQRPDGYRWVCPDAARFLKPGSELANAFPVLAFKYSPNQPRVPAGHPDGGQWTSGTSGPADFADALGAPHANVALPVGDLAISDAVMESEHLFSIALSVPDRSGMQLAGDMPEGSDPSHEPPNNQPPEIPDQMPVT